MRSNGNNGSKDDPYTAGVRDGATNVRIENVESRIKSLEDKVWWFITAVGGTIIMQLLSLLKVVK